VSVPATVANPVGASGGADRESIEHARAHAPGVFRSQHRAVTADDYVALAASFPGVARAQAVAASWNFVDLLVVAEGSLTLTDALRAGLMRWFEPRRPMTTVVNVREPVFVSVDVRVAVAVEPRFFAADVGERVRAAVAGLLALEAVDFGQAVNVSKIFEAVEAVDGVAAADVTFLRGRRSAPPNEVVAGTGAGAVRVPLRPREFPRAGTIRVDTAGGLA
jgi:predicted phage baseplate assembly protein